MKCKLAKSVTVTTQLGAINAPVTIQAAVKEAGADAVPPKFHSVAYSGDRVNGATATPKLQHDYIIDLAGMTAGKNVKANLDHKVNQRVGHVTEFSNDGKQVIVSGLLSAATTHRDEVASSAANGYSWEGSIEASLAKPRLLAAGKSATVNGRTVEGPLYIFGKSVLTDLAFVSHGADGGNEVTIAAAAAKERPMNEFEKYLTKLGLDPETITSEVRAELQAAFDAKQGVHVATTWEATVAANRAEDTRRETIQRMAEDAIKNARKSGISSTAVLQLTNKIDDYVKIALEEGSTVSVRDFELELLRGTRLRADQFQSSMSRKEDPIVVEAAICMASGLPNIEKVYSEQVLDAVDRSGLSKGFSIQQMLMQAAHGNGYSCRPGERIHPGNIRSVLRFALPPEEYQAQLAFSTVSLPNILGAVANKQILAGYMEEDQTWKEIASIKPVSNFYTQNHFRLLDSLEYEEVGSGGEIPHGTLGEETWTSQAKTYGKMLGLTRTQIINDDLGAFDDIRTRLGRGAAKKFNNVFWAAFINNSAFFTAALTNFISGSTTTLLTDGVGLGLAVAAFRQMTSPSADGSKRVGIDFNATKILVPPELETAARINYVNNNAGYVASSSTTPNIYAGMFRPIVQWRLSNSGYTGYSTTAWYLFGDVMKPMCVSFLNGNQTPTVESTEADFDTLGILFRGYHDFGCDKSEYLAGLKSKGAA